MCGRFDFHGSPLDIEAIFGVPTANLSWSANYNIAPTQLAPVIWAPTGDALTCTPLQFGWRRQTGGIMINARSETAARNGMFKQAFQSRRCAVVANGFYEWQQVGKAKQPHYVKRRDNTLCALAALWQPPHSPESQGAFVILTTQPNATVRPLHDRMPVILTPHATRSWITASASEQELLSGLMAPFDDGALHTYPVTTLVNSAKNNDPACIENAQS